MEWPGRAVVSLSAALVEMVETETESELALTKVTNPSLQTATFLL